MDDKVLIGIEEYYGTIKKRYLFRINKVIWLFISQLLLFFSAFFLFLNLVNILSKEDLESLSGYLELIMIYFKEFIPINQLEISNISSNVIGLIFSLLIFLIFLIYNKYWSVKMKKKGLSIQLLQFCHSFYLLNELKLYMINGDNSHAINCRRYIRRVEFQYSQFVPTNGSEREAFSLAEIRKQLSDKFKYIKFDSESNFIIDVMKDLNVKVINRIKNNIDIELLKTFFEYQVVLEFSKIDTRLLDSKGEKLKDNERRYLMEYVNELNAIAEVSTIPNANKGENKNLFNNVFLKFGTILKSSNIFVSFFSWLILLFALCYFCLKILTAIFEVDVDSTILVGAVSIPFIGAYTFSSSFKRK